MNRQHQKHLKSINEPAASYSSMRGCVCECVNVCVCPCVGVCAWMCVAAARQCQSDPSDHIKCCHSAAFCAACVRGRQQESEGERGTERGRGNVSVHLCVCEACKGYSAGTGSIDINKINRQRQRRQPHHNIPSNKAQRRCCRGGGEVVGE